MSSIIDLTHESVKAAIDVATGAVVPPTDTRVAIGTAQATFIQGVGLSIQVPIQTAASLDVISLASLVVSAQLGGNPIPLAISSVTVNSPGNTLGPSDVNQMILTAVDYPVLPPQSGIELQVVVSGVLNASVTEGKFIVSTTTNIQSSN